MDLKIRLGCLTLFVSLMAACGEDETARQAPVVVSPDTSIKSDDSQTDGRTGTRSADSSVRSGFAGFGRVGRSHFSDVDYRARWAVIVGVNRFKNEGLDNLDNAVNDASAVRDILRAEFGYADERIIFLSDQEEDKSGRLKDKDPINKVDILQAFEKLASQDIRHDDAVLFFFAGHGKSDKKGTYLAGYDAVSNETSTWVDAVALKERLRQLPARHKLIILDSCYAGSILDVEISKEKAGDEAAAAITPPAMVTPPPTVQAVKNRSDGDDVMALDDNISYYLQQPAFFAITSGRDQPVGDASKAKPEHSPFTTAFLQVLQERANSAREGDVFTARELAVRVESAVRAGQTPDWGRLEGSRGDFVFKPTRERLTPREIAERDFYAVRIALAEVEIQRHNGVRARKLLIDCPPHQRGFEWHRLLGMSDQSIATLHGHTDRVYAVAVSTDGKRFISGSYDGEVRVWDADQASEALFTVSHGKPVFTVAISADGRRMASGATDGSINIWDAKRKGDPLLSLSGHQDIVHSVVFNSKGDRLVSGSNDRTIKIWDAEKGGEALLTLSGHTGPVHSVVISEDNKRILSGSEDKTIRVWDAEKGGAALRSFNYGQRVAAVAISADGKRIASCGGWFYSPGSIKVFDVEKGGDALITLTGHQGEIRSIALSSDGSYLVSGSDDKTIKVWDTENGGPAILTLLGHNKQIRSVVLSPDGSHVVSAGDDMKLKVWDLDKGDRALAFWLAHKGDVNAIAFNKNGSRLVSCGGIWGPVPGEIKVWNAAATDIALLDLRGHGNHIRSLALSTDGKRIVTGSLDKTIKVWDAIKGGEAQFTLTGHKDSIWTVAFFNDGNRIASASDDHTIRIWGTVRADGALLTLDHGTEVGGMAVSADGGVIASGGSDGTVKVWDLNQDGQLLHTFKHGDDSISSLVFSADGKRLISGGRDQVIKVWDAVAGNDALFTLRGHESVVTCLAISPDGKRLVSGGGKSVKIWNAEGGGEELLTLRFHQSGVNCVAFSPDGNQIISGDTNGYIVVWHANQKAIR